MKRLSDPQFFCLWAIALGSHGSGSNPRTLDSLRRRDLIWGSSHQGEWIWETTHLGESVVDGDERSK